jgi:hypothetical protein
MMAIKNDFGGFWGTLHGEAVMECRIMSTQGTSFPSTFPASEQKSFENIYDQVKDEISNIPS